MIPEPSRQQVNINDLLLIVGQQTVELIYARNRIAELEQRLANPSVNGSAPVEDVQKTTV